MVNLCILNFKSILPYLVEKSMTRNYHTLEYEWMVDLNLINKSITKKPNQKIRFCPWDTWSSTFCLSSTISSCLSYFYWFIGFNLFEDEIFIPFLGLSVVFIVLMI